MELIKQSNATLSTPVTVGTTDKHTVHRRQDAQGETSDTYFQLLMTREVLTHAPGAELEFSSFFAFKVQGGSNMTGTDLCVNKPHCAAAVRP